MTKFKELEYQSGSLLHEGFVLVQEEIVHLYLDLNLSAMSVHPVTTDAPDVNSHSGDSKAAARQGGREDGDA